MISPAEDHPTAVEYPSIMDVLCTADSACRIEEKNQPGKEPLRDGIGNVAPNQ